MGILELITVALFVLKLTLYPEWSWLLVASPFLVALSMYFVLAILMLTGVFTLGRNKRSRK